LPNGSGLPLGFTLALMAGTSFAIVFLLIPRLMPLFARYALARPSARSSRDTPTPQGGGAPIIAAILITLALAGLGEAFVTAAAGVKHYYWLLLAGAVVLALLGALDDIQPLPAGFRLGVQTIIVALVVFGAPESWRLMPALPAPIERAVLVVAGMWFVTLTNFMDGIDWMVVAEFTPMLALLLLWSAFELVSLPAGAVAATLLGGLVGFAPFNRHPARLFLGDVGSLPIGLIIAALLFEVAMRVSLAAALLLPLYFLFDATETLLRGLLGRQNVMQAHRRHAYQNAVDGGCPAPEVTAAVFQLNLGLAVLAGWAALVETAWIAGALLATGLAATILLTRRFRIARL